MCSGRKDLLQILQWLLGAEFCRGNTATGGLTFPFPDGFTIEVLFLLFFYHLGQEAVWFDVGSIFIFKLNMRNTGEETTLCSLK